MKFWNMPVDEPRSLPVFRHVEDLKDHVKVHVLEPNRRTGLLEPWEKLIDPALVADARGEFQRLRTFGPVCQKLTLAYQRYLGESLRDACKAARWHCHSAAYVAACGDTTAQAIECWFLTGRVWIGAMADVIGDRIQTFFLTTGFIKMEWLGATDEWCLGLARERAKKRDLNLPGPKPLTLHDGTASDPWWPA